MRETGSRSSLRAMKLSSRAAASAASLPPARAIYASCVSPAAWQRRSRASSSGVSIPTFRNSDAASMKASCRERPFPSTQWGEGRGEGVVAEEVWIPLTRASRDLSPPGRGEVLSAASKPSGMSFFLHGCELARLIIGDERIDDFVERGRPFEHVRKLVGGEADAVIGDATLREIVGADALGAVAGADLAAAVLRPFGVALGALHLVESRAQHLHRLRLVLVLRLLVLLADHEPGREMRNPDRAIGGVDRLAAWATRPEHVDAQVLVIDLDVDLLGLGKHCDSRGRGVDAPLRLGLRHALHTMHARLEFEPGEHALAGDIGDDLLVASGRRLARRQHINLPAHAIGVALIHAEQIAGEQRSLLAAGAGAHFEDRALLVGGVLGQQL